MEQLLTVKQAAERWQMNPEVVRRKCAKGEIKALRIGKLWRICASENEQ